MPSSSQGGGVTAAMTDTASTSRTPPVISPATPARRPDDPIVRRTHPTPAMNPSPNQVTTTTSSSSASLAATPTNPQLSTPPRNPQSLSTPPPPPLPPPTTTTTTTTTDRTHQVSTPSTTVQHLSTPRPSNGRTSASTTHTSPTQYQQHHPSDAVLPRATAVRISGNNRTKTDLINRVGTIRSAQTLGGWHEVELANNTVVRVQRNALQVLRLPPPETAQIVVTSSSTGGANAATSSTGAGLSGSARKTSVKSEPNEHTRRKSSANTTSGNNHRTNIPVLDENTNSQRKPRSYNPSNHNTSNPKSIANSSALSRDASNGKPLRKVSDGRVTNANIARLNVNSLRKYRKYYKLDVARDCPKEVLVSAVRNHFANTSVDEAEVINMFLKRARQESASTSRPSNAVPHLHQQGQQGHNLISDEGDTTHSGVDDGMHDDPIPNESDHDDHSKRVRTKTRRDRPSDSHPPTDTRGITATSTPPTRTIPNTARVPRPIAPHPSVAQPDRTLAPALTPARTPNHPPARPPS